MSAAAHHVTAFRAGSVATALLPAGHTEAEEIIDRYFERFGIDDARELVRIAHQRPATATVQHLVVRTEFITREAQNALLKVLEEPPVSTRFTFVLPQDFTVLPTLASRMETGAQLSGGAEDQTAFTDFLAGTPAERLQQIERAVKQKDIAWQRAIKEGLIAYLKSTKVADESLARLEFVTRWLLTRGASNKMLLEQAALTLDVRSDTKKVLH